MASNSQTKSAGAASTKRSTGRVLRRLLMASAAAVASAAWLGVGCGTGFDPISKVNTLRVFSVVPEKVRECEDVAACLEGETCDEGRCRGEDCASDEDCLAGERCLTEVCRSFQGASYANPGDVVRFKMTYEDGFVDPDDPEAGPRPVQIAWLGGCYDPEGDQYFDCYDQIADLLLGFAETIGGLEGGVPEGELPPLPEEFAFGPGLDEFTLRLPLDIISRRPEPPSGPHYGIAYVFFALCAGELRLVPSEGTSDAGSFPLGCFDPSGKRLGAESFLPGYTQVYAFADGRTNANPRVSGLALDGNEIPAGESPTVAACALTEEERNFSGCDAKDPKEECTVYEVDVLVPSDVAEVDPDGTSLEGEQLTEPVWVDYYADGGDLESSVKLVSDALAGYNDDHSVEWLPPDKPGLYNVWAVVHDARGGSAIVSREILVQ